ncbi:uncharacterized protein LOC107017925 [Solanum pennellii]|uniref:Uncharacterized protein LOC107017925 n=1 Tax=Solanum pennellii TaxID=28526 RepID=A0ABM1GNK6_SOLPN|nr:uncharacterized protein LOC107017925 [Solanum pennellii]
MLRQSSSRNMRTKGLKLKDVLQGFALFLMCLWLIYQAKQAYNKSKLGEKSLKGQDLQKAAKLGRKDLNPLLLDELAGEFQKNPDEDLELEELLDEAKKDGDDVGDGVGDNEQLEDIVDEDAASRDAV